MNDGILGRNLMKREEAVISYYTNCLMIAGDVMNPIPFLTPEERHFHIQRRPELNERYEKEYNKRMVMISQQQKSDMNKENHPTEIGVESVANS